MTKKAQVPLSHEQTELEAARSDYKLAADYLDKHPHLVNRFGTLAGRAKAAWQWLGTDGDKLEIEAIDRNLAELRRELLGPSASKLEQLLATRIEICWLQVHTFDLREAVGGGRSLAHAALGLKRQDRAHRRYLSALKALAEIRRMQTPAVQVNIAQRQVNVGTVSEPTRNLAAENGATTIAAEASTVETKP